MLWRLVMDSGFSLSFFATFELLFFKKFTPLWKKPNQIQVCQEENLVLMGLGYVPDPSLLKKMRDAISKKYFPFNPYLATVSFIYPHLNSFETLVFQCNSYLYREVLIPYMYIKNLSACSKSYLNALWRMWRIWKLFLGQIFKASCIHACKKFKRFQGKLIVILRK